MKPRHTTRLSFPLAAALAALLAAPSAHAASPYTWTQNSAATQTWTTTGNWNSSNADLGPGTTTDVLNFFANTTTALTAGNNAITGSVPALTMNVLTLNGLGAATTGATNVTIGTSAATWTLDGTTPTVNLNGLKGTQGLNYTVAVKLALAQDTTAFTGNGTAGFTFSGLISGVGKAITKSGTSTLTLSGANTYTGSTTVSAGTLVISGSPTGNSAVSVNGGKLQLDYSTNNTTKIHDSAILTLGGGTLELAGGSHTEVVASTSLAASSASSVTRTSGTSVLRMNAITRNADATINFGAASIADTTTTNTNGMLGLWATVGGADWAINSTNAANGPITAYAGYTDVQRLTPGTIADGSTTNVRLIEGSGSAGNITLGATTTTINSLNQSASGGSSAATIDTASKTLATSAILVGTGAGALTIGTAVNSGTLMAATSGGNLLMQIYTANTVTVNSVIANNTSASSFTKSGSGTLTLTGANTYTGLTTVSAGKLLYGANDVIYTGDVTVNGATTILDMGANHTDSVGIVTVDNGGSITGSGTSALTSTGSFEMKSGSVSAVLAGSGIALNKTTTGTVNLSGASTYSGGTTVSAGTLKISANSTPTTGTVTSGPLGTGTLIFKGGTVTGGGTTIANAIQVNATAGNVLYSPAGNMFLNGAITGSGTLSVTGNTGAACSILLGGDNSGFTGTISYNNNAGTGNNTLAIATAVAANLSNATLNFPSGSMSSGGRAFSLNPYTGTVQLGALSGTSGIISVNALEVGNLNTSTTFGGALGVTALTKVGTGSLTLTYANTYSGGTTVSAGSMVAGVSNVGTTSGAFGPSTNTVTLGDAATTTNNSSPAVLIGGAFTLSNPITIANQATTGTYALGGSTANASSFTGNITLNQPVTLQQVASGTVEFITGTWATNDKAITIGSSGKTGTVKLSNAISTTGGINVNYGTCLLGAGGSLAAATGVSIAAGATFNVTAHAAYTWNTASLSASGTASAATLAGAPGGTIAMGSNPITLTYDGTHPALTVTGATLSLNNNAFTVNGASVLANGDYHIVTAAGAITDLSTTYPTPTGTALTGKTASITVSSNNVVLHVSGASGYAGWALTNAPSGGANADYDGDGVSNAVEYVLGGSHTTNDLGKLPTSTTTGGNLVFSFERDQASIGNATVTIEVSTDLATWNTSPYTVPDVAAANNPGVTVAKDTPVAGKDTVTLTVSQSPGTNKFARLSVVVPTP